MLIFIYFYLFIYLFIYLFTILLFSLNHIVKGPSRGLNAFLLKILLLSASFNINILLLFEIYDCI